jgi:D-lactate dehydrogenase (cytochrome)
MPRQTNPVWLEALRRLLPPDRLSTRRADLEAASHDESTLPQSLPEAVVWPSATEEVAAVIRHAHAHGVAVTARGAGSSLEGNCVPLAAGVVLDLSRMRRVVSVDAGDMTVRVEPGVVYDALNRELQPHGLFFPPHPGGSADVATIGGMVATNASGIYSVRYGGTRDYVRAAVAVTGTGEVVRLGNACRKVSSGYHLIGLLVGSEGTLAIATEITLALAPLPQARRSGAFSFGREEDAAAAVAALMRFGVPVAAVEFLDRRCLAAVNRFLSAALPERPFLLLEVHGSEAHVDDDWSAAGELCREHGGDDGGSDPWSVRHQVTRAIQALQPGSRIIRTDLALPVSCLPEVVRHSYELADAGGLSLHVFGHAGLGVLHELILAPGDTPQWQSAMRLKDEIVAFVLGLGGSVSGEHGLGFGNRKYAALEHRNTLPLMRDIKRLFDPKGILNPGKIWE